MKNQLFCENQRTLKQTGTGGFTPVMRLSLLSLVPIVVASFSSAAVAQKSHHYSMSVDEWRDLFSRQPTMVEGACEKGREYNGINKSYFWVLEQAIPYNGAASFYVLSEEILKVCPDVW
ncbi:hypothetical protein [Synechococcus sp. MIT S1220]|uniref:hypothetical protein n=1 Tax=Synechococcus sp. MIT S1220 TaxID=3082549 RepID=UPI0039B0678D